MDLNPISGVIIKRGREDIQRLRPYKDESRDWSDVATTQGRPRNARAHQKVGRSKEGDSPRAFREARPCQHPDFRILAFKTGRE